VRRQSVSHDLVWIGLGDQAGEPARKIVIVEDLDARALRGLLAQCGVLLGETTVLGEKHDPFERDALERQALVQGLQPRRDGEGRLALVRHVQQQPQAAGGHGRGVLGADLAHPVRRGGMTISALAGPPMGVAKALHLQRHIADIGQRVRDAGQLRRVEFAQVAQQIAVAPDADRSRRTA